MKWEQFYIFDYLTKRINIIYEFIPDNEYSGSNLKKSFNEAKFESDKDEFSKRRTETTQIL